MAGFSIVVKPLPAAAVAAVEAALEGAADAVSCFEFPEDAALPVADRRWSAEAFAEDRPDAAALAAGLDLAAAAAGVAVPDAEIAALPDTDWLEATKRAFPPFDVGRFHIRGGHVDGPPPAASIPLLFDAGAAFGTGEHPTTRGCLAALETVAKRNGGGARPGLRVLDMGCGSGILATAAVKLFGCTAVAVDLDARAVAATAVAARANGVADRIRVLQGATPRMAAVAGHGPYDLILANILAGPLKRLARDVTSVLRPGGLVILSGLLDRQERDVAVAYRRRGLPLARRFPDSGWHTLVLRG